MSTTRCSHGNVIDDQLGEYRCLQCDPISEEELEERDGQVEALEARVEYLEGIVAQLADAHGLAFQPPEA